MGRIRDEFDAVVPNSFEHHLWRQFMCGNFIDAIYDSSGEMWHIIENREIATLVKGLTEKQKEAVFLGAVRFCTMAQTACYKDQTDRVVHKLLAATLDSMQKKLVSLVAEQIKPRISR